MTTAVAAKTEFNVFPLNAAEVVTIWDMLFIAIQDSGLYQDSAIAQMLLDCMDGRQQAWLMRREDGEGVKTLDGIIVTEIRQFPYTQDKVFQIVHLSTLNRSFDLKKWVQVNKALTRYAKREGCNKARLFTEHAGLQDILRQMGFKALGVFEKEL